MIDRAKGTWKEGKLNGTATVYYQNGAMYKGASAVSCCLLALVTSFCRRVAGRHATWTWIPDIRGRLALHWWLGKRLKAWIRCGCSYLTQTRLIDDQVSPTTARNPSSTWACGPAARATAFQPPSSRTATTSKVRFWQCQRSCIKYCTGTFVNGRLSGRGLLLTSKDVAIDGEFSDDTYLMGKGLMMLPSGDFIEGLLTGDWRDQEGLKVRSHHSNACWYMLCGRSTAHLSEATRRKLPWQRWCRQRW